MSTEDQNRCVVTVNKGVDVDALMAEITSLGGTTPHVPQRTVEMWNEKQDSLYNFDVVLTRSEAETLKQDPRIIDVRYGSKEENGIFLQRNILDASRNYSRSTAQNNSHYAWAIPSCTNTVNPFSTLNLNYQHAYTAIGENVDAVIQDSGIEVGHPEWLAQNGSTSRLQLINWPIAADLAGSYTQGPAHYTDTYGHGTHCAGTTAGRRYGWARAANIFAIKIFDTDAFGVSASFNMMRAWHNLKTNNNPTVVNMSWGYYQTYQNIVSGNYRGTAWTATTPQSIYGMMSYNDIGGGVYAHPIRVSSVDADITACIDAGMILVAAAGNDTHKQDVPGGLDYDNYYTTSGASTRYYHRGSTPNGPTGVISVGAIRAALTENKSAFSTCGPGITVYAPGEAVQSAMPLTATLGSGSVAHPDNAAFYIKKIQGTSMASPQVAGVLACLVGSRRHYDAADCIRWLSTTGSTPNRITDTGGGYTDQTSLQGSPNRYLRWPFTNDKPLTITAS